MNSIDEVVEKVRLSFLISEKIIEFGLGAVYYAVRNQAIKAAGINVYIKRNFPFIEFKEGRGYREDSISIPHRVLILGKENFVSGGRQMSCDLKDASTCAERCKLQRSM